MKYNRKSRGYKYSVGLKIIPCIKNIICIRQRPLEKIAKVSNMPKYIEGNFAFLQNLGED